MKKFILSLVVIYLCLNVAQAAYHRQYLFKGKSFFDNFDFYDGDDPTQGYVNYVNRETAFAKGYASAMYDDQAVYIGADHVNEASGRGRDSVRISSKAVFNSGLFILDIAHMPEGCGTWPAYWLFGPNWPNSGEIDIIEGVNTMTKNQVTLHTNQGCDMVGQSSEGFTGTWAPRQDGLPMSNCWVNAPLQDLNAGCGIYKEGIYGAPLNSMGGGVYVMEWTDQFIRAYFFPRYAIPSDIALGQPNPESWGKPLAYFEFGPNCPKSHFVDHNLIINLTFCGEWSARVFADQCPGKGLCNDYVRFNPQAFSNSFWLINYISVYQKS